MEIENFSYRYATEGDVALITKLVRQLAEYENMFDHVVATEELMKKWIFDEKKAEVIFALEGDTVVGMALFFHNFSTFL
jgi:hypothetical protein